MDRKWSSGAAVSAPALTNASDGFATSGNPGTGTPATKPGAHWYHMITEEQLAVILAAGITPDKTDVTQVLAATQAMFSGGAVVNGRITVTPAANAWTIALKTLSGADASATAPIFVAFRHGTAADGSRVIRKVTGALSMVISSGSTLGHSSATNQDVFVYVVDNAGTVELAVSKLSPETDGTFASARLISTTAEGGAGAADSGTGIYSTTARSNVPWVCVGRVISNQATAGTWASAAVLIDMAPFVLAATTVTEPPSVPGGRLTLTTAVPVTTSDVTAATTIYYTPYQSDRVQLYNGTLWAAVQFTELSQSTTDNTKSPAAAANTSNYDMFVWSDSGTIRCTRGPAWTSGTARGTGAGTTELELFEGRLVNKIAITNGPAARRGLYVGTVGTNGSAQLNDSMNLRMVWNHYNRRIRPLRRVEATSTWTQASGSYRQANASTANQVDVITGLNDEIVNCVVAGTAGWAGGSPVLIAQVAVGLDSTTTKAAGSLTSTFSTIAANEDSSPFASFSDFVGLGRHSLVWLEASANQTATWQGAANASRQCGINGSIRA